MKKLQQFAWIILLAIVTSTLVACGGEPNNFNPTVNFELKHRDGTTKDDCDLAKTKIKLSGFTIDETKEGSPDVAHNVEKETNDSVDPVHFDAKDDKVTPGTWRLQVTLSEEASKKCELAKGTPEVVIISETTETKVEIFVVKKLDDPAATIPDLAGATALLKQRRESLVTKNEDCDKLDAKSSETDLQNCINDLKGSAQEVKTNKQTVNQLIRVVKGIDPNHASIAPAQQEEANADRTLGKTTEVIAKLQNLLDNKRQSNPNKVDLKKLSDAAKAAREAAEKGTDCSKKADATADELKTCKGDISNLERKLKDAEKALADAIRTIEANDPSNSDLANAKDELKKANDALDTLTKLLVELQSAIDKIENSGSNTGNNTGTAIIKVIDTSNSALTGATIKEVRVNWKAAGKTQPSKTSASDGTAKFEGLPLNKTMEFAVDLNGYYGKNLSVTLTDSFPAEFVVQLQKQSSVAKFSCTSLLIKKGDTQTLDCHQEDGQGAKTLVTSSMTCSSSDKAIATVSSDCRKVTAVAKGCATITVTYKGKSWKSGIRTYESLSSLPSCTPPTNP